MLYKLLTPLTVAVVVPVLLAVVEEPVDMAIPDMDVPDMSPEVVIDHVMLESGEGGFIVSRTSVLGVEDPLRLAETSNGMMTDGIEVMVLVMSASVQVVTAVAAMVMDDSAVLSVVDTSIPDIVSIWATAVKAVRARRKIRKAITAENHYSLTETGLQV